jgi:NADP-reducing hydrogenase subunit HndA
MSTFKLQDCHKETIKGICKSFDNNPGELISILHKTQGEFGYLPEDVQREIAKNLKISVAKVYGVVTFYSFFTMTPKGKHPISVCMGTACYVRGAEKIVDELKEQLKIKVGGVTPDGKFSLDCLRCVGACGLAPVVIIGEKVYGRVEVDQVREILDNYKDEE